MPNRSSPYWWLNTLVAAGCVCFALPLIAHAYSGTASRYVGDDYCAGYIFRDHGFIGGQVWHYKDWSAVPTTLFLMALTDPGGARLAPVLPMVALALWVIFATWAVRRISAWTGSPWSWLLSLCLAEAIIFATLQDTPNVAQSVYLRVPMLAYVCPLVVLTAYVAWLARTERRSAGFGMLLASGAFGFVFGAFGPVCAALLTTALGLAWLWARTQLPGPQSHASRRVLLAGCAGAIAALMFVALAPGNAVRQGYFPRPPGLITVGAWSVLYSAFMFGRPLVPLLRGPIVAAVPHVIGSTPRWLPVALDMAISPIPLLSVIALSAGVGMLREPRTVAAPKLRRACWWIPALAFILVCACMAPGAYGTSAPPPPRALIIPQFVITSLGACWGFTLGAALFSSQPRLDLGRMQRLAWLTAGCLILVVPITATPHIISTGTTMRRWAERWDQTDKQLREAHAAGVLDATVPALETVAGVGSISPDQHDWVNTCAAHYYGLRSITGSAASR